MYVTLKEITVELLVGTSRIIFLRNWFVLQKLLQQVNISFKLSETICSRNIFFSRTPQCVLYRNLSSRSVPQKKRRQSSTFQTTTTAFLSPTQVEEGNKANYELRCRFSPLFCHAPPDERGSPRRQRQLPCREKAIIGGWGGCCRLPAGVMSYGAVSNDNGKAYHRSFIIHTGA